MVKHSGTQPITEKIAPKTSLGRQGECIAREFLEKKRYEVFCQNWHAGKSGEIDLVVIEPPASLIFVEVKTRRTGSHGFPIEALTLRKREQLITLAQQFLAQHPQFEGWDLRFDFIGIYLPSPHLPSEVQHLENIVQ